MDGVAGFAAGYALFTELAALGIMRVGVIAARRAAGVAEGESLPWPHDGSITLHTVVATVATVAAVLLALVIAAIHHSAVDLALLAVPVALGTVVLARQAARLRHDVERVDVDA
jgi:hypothetical protein